ncbi:MAG: protein kinase, partial [Kofleriaceae bacterium]|nr:protein kinase [Kofleriaceae bacterium]
MDSLPQKTLHGELSPGTTFGPYCILSHLATGGMAEIYLARASKIRGFQRLVVVKRIRPDSAQNEEFVEMFLDEARLVASLQHAHIAQVFDIGEFEGNYFFTMEFVRGEEVASILRRGWQRQKKIPLNHILNIITQAASGLHYAHNRRDGNGDLRGIIHRDVSPSNILVGSDGSVKVIDFGVAKATNKEHQTTVGALKGKLAYMSPEQVVAKDVDRRSDVFSLGIVLYEMLTGQRLFQGDSDFLILNKVMNAEIKSPSSIRPECPSQLDAIALKALSRNVDERYSSCEEFQIALEECAYDNHLKLNQRGLALYLDQTFPEKRDFWEASQREDSSVEEFLVSNPTLIKAEVGTLDPTEYDALSRSDIVLDDNASVLARNAESGTSSPNVVVSQSLLPPVPSAPSALPRSPLPAVPPVFLRPSPVLTPPPAIPSVLTPPPAIPSVLTPPPAILSGVPMASTPIALPLAPPPRTPALGVVPLVAALPAVALAAHTPALGVVPFASSIPA